MRKKLKKAAMGKYLGIAGIVVLVMLIAAGAIFVVTRSNDGKNDITITVEQIKAIAQLSSVEYTISEIDHVTLPKSWYEWSNAEFLVILTGTVTGSVDLDKVTFNIDEKTKLVKLDFAKDAILIKDPQIGVGKLKIITISDPNVFNKINDDHRNNAFKCAFSQILKTAEDQGIRAKTGEEAEVALAKFVQAMGFTAEITFAAEDLTPKQIDTSACDPSIFKNLTGDLH